MRSFFLKVFIPMVLASLGMGFIIAALLLGAISAVGCGNPKPTIQPKEFVGCEYFFDNRGVRGFYWMSGPPHKDLWIRACYDVKGTPYVVK